MGANPAPVEGKRIHAPYATFVFSLTCFTAVAASCTYLLAQAANE
jgi:hypothetical protein